MAAQVEAQPGELGLTGAATGLHLSPLSDSSNKSRIEVPSVDKSSVIAPEPCKPVPTPKPRLTPKPFVVERNPTIKPILAPKPQTKPRPESTRLAGHKPDLPSTPKPTTKPLSAISNRPAPTFYKTSNKSNLAQTTKPVAQPFKSAPPFDPDDPSKQTSSAPAKKQKPVVSNFAYSKSLAVPTAAEWSGTTAKEKETNVKSKNKVGASITRAKSMGFLDEVGFEKEEKDEAKCEIPVPLRPKSSRPRPVSAIFPDSLNKAEKPVPAPCWAGRRPLSADLTSKFESIGLSLHRKSSDENFPAERMPPQKTEDVQSPALKSEKKTEESAVKETEEEKQRPNIKSRISRLFDPSSLSVAGSTGQDPQSPVQPSPETETETSVDVKQLIKQLTEDPTPTQSPALKPTPKPRPLSIDLTKRFSSEKSPDLNTGTEAADRHEISKVSQRGDEELANTPNDHKILYDLKESEEQLKDDSTSEGSSAKETSNTSQNGGPAGELHTVRAFLFDVERHNVTISEEKPASLAKDFSRKPSFKRESVDGALSSPVFEEPTSPSTPLYVVHAFDTVQAIEEKRAVSESVPSAQWEDKAMTLRSRRSDTSRPGVEWIDQPQIQPPVEVTPVPRYLRVGALPKWNTSDLNQDSILGKGTKKESQREALVDKEGDGQRWADEEEGAAAHKYLKREKEEQPKPRATYFALTGQMQEPVSPRDAGTREMTVPTDNSSVRSALGGSQTKVLSVKRNPSLEEAFERSTSLQQLEAMMRRQLSPTNATSHTDKQSKEKVLEVVKENLETERQNLQERVREQAKETQRQLEEEKKRSSERIIEVDGKELLDVKKPRLKEKERQLFHEVERQKHKENIEEIEKVKQKALERELLKERDKQKEIEGERQKQMQQDQERREQERQRELAKEKMRKRDEERQRELDKERQQLEMQQEKQRMEEMEKQKELERQQLELQREKEKQWLAEEAEKIKLRVLEQEKMRLKEQERERARQRELEHQREVEREKQKEMQKRRWQEIERLRQREEKERQWQLEREKQELERQREIEREVLQEQERAKERQRDEERQKQLDRERMQLEMQQEKHRREEEKRELEMQQLELQKQRQKELERQQLAEEAEKLRQAALEQERLKLKELEKEREKQREIELQKEMEREKQRQLEIQRQLDLDKQEFENQKLRKRELKERTEKEEAEKLRLVAKQQEAERQRLREKQRKDEERLKLESSVLRPKVLDLDSVLRDELSPKASSNPGDPSTRWREPYKPAILDIDSFKPEAQPSPNKDLFPVSSIQELDAAFGFKSNPAPERDPNWKVPPQPTAVWTMSPQDPWELQPVEMSVDKPVIEPKKSLSTISPQQPFQKQEERLPYQQNDWAAFLNERFHAGPLTGTEVRTRNSLGFFSGSPRGEEIWVPRESQSRSPRRSQGSQELNRMRSRSVSRKSARSNSSMEENVSRMRSRSANREQDRHSWVQQTQSGEEERKNSETPVRETDSQYGTWETGLRSDDSLTSVTPSSDSFLSPSPRKPSPPTSPGDNALLSDKDTLDGLPPSSSSESQPLSFPDAPTTLLDNSALRSRAQLGKKRAPRSRPTRAARQSAAQSEENAATSEDWLYRDSTEAKPEIQETELECEEPTRGTDVGLAVPSQPQRVAVFPGLDPSALKTQLKRRSDCDHQPDGPAPSPSQPSRSPKSPFLPRATRVLPPPGGKENGEEDSPKWLKELKSKKRFSQYENENN